MFGSYRVRVWTVTGRARPTITVAERAIAVEGGAGYEIVTQAGEVVSVRKLQK